MNNIGNCPVCSQPVIAWKIKLHLACEFLPCGCGCSVNHLSFDKNGFFIGGSAKPQEKEPYPTQTRND